MPAWRLLSAVFSLTILDLQVHGAPIRRHRKLHLMMECAHQAGDSNAGISATSASIDIRVFEGK